MEPSEAQRELGARLVWFAEPTNDPAMNLIWTQCRERIAQALADEYARGIVAGVDKVLAEVDDWYQHPAGMLLERIRSLKSTP